MGDPFSSTLLGWFGDPTAAWKEKIRETEDLSQANMEALVTVNVERRYLEQRGEKGSEAMMTKQWRSVKTLSNQLKISMLDIRQNYVL